MRSSESAHAIGGSTLLLAAVGACLGFVLVVGRTEIPFGIHELLPGGVGQLRWLAVMFASAAAFHLWTTATLSGRGPRRLDIASILCVVLLLLISLSALWSRADPSQALRPATESLGLATLALITMSVAHDEQSSRQVRMWMFLALICLGSVLLLAGIMAVARGSTGRLAVLGGGPIIYGRLMAMFALAVLSPAGSFLHRRLKIGAVAAAVLLIVLTGSRGSLLAALVAAAFLTFRLRTTLRRSIGRAEIVQLVLVVSLFLSVTWSRIVPVFQTRFIQLILEGYTAGRDRISARALKLIVEHPEGGLGVGSYLTTGVSVYPHNVFLEIGVSAGIIPMLLFAFLCVYVIARAMRSDSDPSVGAIVILVLVSAQFSGDLWDSRAVFMLLPFLVAASTNSESKMLRQASAADRSQ